MDFTSVNTFYYSLIDAYIKEEIKNNEFELSMIQTFLRDGESDLIIYALNAGFALIDKIKDEIMKSGNLKLYQHLYQLKILKLDEVAMCYASFSGNLDTVKWLLSSGYPLCEDLAYHFAGLGQLEMLQETIKMGCPFNPVTLIKSGKKYPEIVEYIELYLNSVEY